MAHLSRQVSQQPYVSTSRLGLNTRGQDVSGPLIPTFEVHLVAALIWGKGPHLVLSKYLIKAQTQPHTAREQGQKHTSLQTSTVIMGS